MNLKLLSPVSLRKLSISIMIFEYMLYSPALRNTWYVVYFVIESGLAHINHIFLWFDYAQMFLNCAPGILQKYSQNHCCSELTQLPCTRTTGTRYKLIESLGSLVPFTRIWIVVCLALLCKLVWSGGVYTTTYQFLGLN